MKKIIYTQMLLVFSLIGCSLLGNKNIKEADRKYIQSLGLLNNEEKILLFSTSLNVKTSGNFITNQRIASYWIDDKEKTKKKYAYYSNIIKIDTVDLTKAWTYNSYLIITKNDSTKFKVYIEGNKNEYNIFVKTAFESWEKYK